MLAGLLTNQTVSREVALCQHAPWQVAKASDLTTKQPSAAIEFVRSADMLFWHVLRSKMG